LSDEKVLELGQLGVYLEKAFGGPRDLEFAVSGGALYLLQVKLRLVLFVVLVL
jgi:phosphoenolpyruvate synthase/pyruvate phosphate dikinase